MSMMNATQLKPGQSARIAYILEGEARLKLMELGCIPDSEIKLLTKAPLGGPIAFEVAGYVLSMRRSEAELIVLQSTN